MSQDCSIVLLLDFSRVPERSQDSHSSDSMEHELYVQNVCKATKITINKVVSRMASSSFRHLIHLCIVDIGDSGIDVALPLRKATIVEGHRAVNKIEQKYLQRGIYKQDYHEHVQRNISQVGERSSADTLLMALGCAVNSFLEKQQQQQQQQKRHPTEIPFNKMKVVCITHSWSQCTMKCSPQVDMLLKDLYAMNCNLTFLRVSTIVSNVVFGTMSQANEADDHDLIVESLQRTREFNMKMDSHPNITVSSIMNDPAVIETNVCSSIHDCVRHISSHSSRLIINLKPHMGEGDQEAIDCFADCRIIDRIGFQTVEICQCHHIPVNESLNKSGQAMCNTTMRLLDRSDVVRCISAGGEIAHILMERSDQGGRSAYSIAPELNVISRVNLDSVCDSFIFGKGLLLSPSNGSAMQSWEQCFNNESKFVALASHLQRRDIGLLVQSTTDLASNTTLEGGCIKYYLIMSIRFSGTSTLLLKELSSMDEMASHSGSSSTKPRDESLMRKVDGLLDAIPLQDFNPMAISSRFHEKLDEFMKQSPSIQPKIQSQARTNRPSLSSAVGVAKQTGRFQPTVPSSSVSGPPAHGAPLHGRAPLGERRSRLMTHRISKSN